MNYISKQSKARDEVEREIRTSKLCSFFSQPYLLQSKSTSILWAFWAVTARDSQIGPFRGRTSKVTDTFLPHNIYLGF